MTDTTPTLTDEQRMSPEREHAFWAKVIDDGDCWLWVGARCRKGYGSFWLDGRSHKAHRLAYELMRGEIPAGLQIDHLCRVRNCVNPYHLEPVPNVVNARRGNAGAHLRNGDVCAAGEHPWPESAITYGAGVTTCGPCKRRRNNASARRLRQQKGSKA